MVEEVGERYARVTTRTQGMTPMQSLASTATRSFPPAAFTLREPMATPRRSDIATQGNRRSLVRGEEVYAEGEDSGFFYEVVSGSVRICKLLSDGRRQIESFHFAGDVFGLEAGRTHRFTAEAVGDLQVIAHRNSHLDRLVREEPALASKLMASLLANLDRAQDHMVLLGRKSARERIASFLLDLADRLDDGARFELPMQRADIADHLGLTIETVSRTLTQLTAEGLIRLRGCGRTVEVLHRARLEALRSA